MPIEPVKIPQNVQIEDRIIGSITLRQLIMSVIGCGISYTIWSNLQKLFGSVSIPVTIIAWLPAVIFVAFAFLKVHDLSLLRIVLLTLEKSVKPQMRTWAPRTGISIVSPHIVAKKKTPAIEQKKPTSIEELSSMLDITQKETEKPTTAQPIA